MEWDVGINYLLWIYNFVDDYLNSGFFYLLINYCEFCDNIFLYKFIYKFIYVYFGKMGKMWVLFLYFIVFFDLIIFVNVCGK